MKSVFVIIAILVISFLSFTVSAAPRPNIVLVMADDMGWGQTGYYRHPVLKTPHLDAMAQSGLRFDRFYAGAPVCSPTRATVLTGRSNERTGVMTHGYALRRQEKTIVSALRDAGYATGHFGKWHLNGMRGPGVPMFATDSHHPGKFGFDKWLSVTNFFDRNPIMSRQGKFAEFTGDSSEIIVDEALKFIAACAGQATPSFTIIWYGTPHSPFIAADEDKKAFADLDTNSQNHYAELVAMDRSIGALRSGLRRLNIAENTLVWFCSDNGGLPKIKPETVGGLRGNKGSLYEGGLRVPAIIEWPAGISRSRVTKYPAATMDIFPTIAEIINLPDAVMLQPQDGMNLVPLFSKELGRRPQPIPFSCMGNAAMLDNNYKILYVSPKRGSKAKQFELFDLDKDPKETTNLMTTQPVLAKQMQGSIEAWMKSKQASYDGKDYPEGRVMPGDPEPRYWTKVKEYEPYFDKWRHRPEYKSRLK